jgi:hypothetical protein
MLRHHAFAFLSASLPVVGRLTKPLRSYRTVGCLLYPPPNYAYKVQMNRG